MNSKRILITIVSAVVITISYIKLLSLAASNFMVVDSEIVFDFRALDVKLHFVLFYLLTIIPWKVVLWERDWFDIFIMQGVYFPFFMMFLMGWFTLDIPTSNFIATLSYFTGWMVGWALSFVLLCTIGEAISRTFAPRPEEKAKNQDPKETAVLGLALAASLIAAKLEKQESNDAG